MFKHKNNCNCDHCIFKLDNHEERILKLENKKKQKKNKTNKPKIPVWFKLWDQQRFQPLVDDVHDLKHRVSNLETKVDSIDMRVSNLETKVDSIDIRVSNLETNAVTKNDLKELLKSSAFKNVNN